MQADNIFAEHPIFQRRVVYAIAGDQGFEYMTEMRFTEHELRAIAVMLEAGMGVVGHGYVAKTITDQFTKAYRDTQRANLG